MPSVIGCSTMPSILIVQGRVLRACARSQIDLSVPNS